MKLNSDDASNAYSKDPGTRELEQKVKGLEKFKDNKSMWQGSIIYKLFFPVMKELSQKLAAADSMLDIQTEECKKLSAKFDEKVVEANDYARRIMEQLRILCTLPNGQGFCLHDKCLNRLIYSKIVISREQGFDVCKKKYESTFNQMEQEHKNEIRAIFEDIEKIQIPIEEMTVTNQKAAVGPLNWTIGHVTEFLELKKKYLGVSK